MPFFPCAESGREEALASVEPVEAVMSWMGRKWSCGQLTRDRPAGESWPFCPVESGSRRGCLAPPEVWVGGSLPYLPMCQRLQMLCFRWEAGAGWVPGGCCRAESGKVGPAQRGWGCDGPHAQGGRGLTDLEWHSPGQALISPLSKKEGRRCRVGKGRRRALPGCLEACQL